ncbi:putative CCCH-type zinc finger family protein [Tanacetum coccineum]
MKRDLRRRFLPPNLDQILFNLLQNCVQGNRSVEVYTAEFHYLSSRNNLSETECQQVTRYVNGLSHEIQDRISLVPVYTLDDAYNLAIKAENQLAKHTRPSVFSSRNNSLSIQSTSKPESRQYGSNSAALDKKKQSINTSTVITKSTNPYDHPIIGKCFKCGLPGHRSSDCRGTGKKFNLTLKEDEYDEEEENDKDSDDKEYDTYMCHPESGPLPYSFWRPWEFDVNATYKGKDNTYSFRVNGVKKILMPLIENSKPKVLEEKRNNLMIASHRDFEDEIRGELVIYAVVARGMIQECVSNKIPEKLLPLMEEFQSLIPDELPSTLPLMRNIQHQIDLVPGASLPNLPHYRMIPKENLILQEQVEDLLKKGLIRESMSPCTVPALLVPKKDGSWQMCVDSRAINKITIAYRFLIPCLDDMLDMLEGSKIFSKIDL